MTPQGLRVIGKKKKRVIGVLFGFLCKALLWNSPIAMRQTSVGPTLLSLSQRSCCVILMSPYFHAFKCACLCFFDFHNTAKIGSYWLSMLYREVHVQSHAARWLWSWVCGGFASHSFTLLNSTVSKAMGIPTPRRN